MSGTIKIFLVVIIVALAIWALQFLPQTGLSSAVTDFAGGMAAGLFIGMVVVWAGQRAP